MSFFSGSAFRGLPLRATTSEDSSSGTNQYVAEERDTITAVEVEVGERPTAAENSYTESFSSVVSNEEPPTPGVQAQSFELLENIDLQVCIFIGLFYSTPFLLITADHSCSLFRLRRPEKEKELESLFLDMRCRNLGNYMLLT